MPNNLVIQLYIAAQFIQLFISHNLTLNSTDTFVTDIILKRYGRLPFAYQGAQNIICILYLLYAFDSLAN